MAEYALAGGTCALPVPPKKQVLGDVEWIERFFTIPKNVQKNFLVVSGQDGIYVKPFRTMNAPEETNTRICWLGELASLSETLEKVVGARTLGLEVGPRGLGVRVLTDGYTENHQHLLPQGLADAENRRLQQKLYEIRAFPPWVAFEQLQINETTVGLGCGQSPCDEQNGIEHFLSSCFSRTATRS